MKSQNKSKSQFLFGPAAAWWRFVLPIRVLFPTNQPTNQPPPLFQWTKYWRGKKKKKKNGGGANSPTIPLFPSTPPPPEKPTFTPPFVPRSTVPFWVTLSHSRAGGEEQWARTTEVICSSKAQEWKFRVQRWRNIVHSNIIFYSIDIGCILHFIIGPASPPDFRCNLGIIGR